MGYYDHHALVTIDKPVSLIGFSGAGVHRATYFLSSMTGLPFTDVDRQVEHLAGRSVAQIVIEEGEAAWRKLEQQVVLKSLRETPPRILCLGEGALLDAKVRKEVMWRSKLVYVRRPREVLLRNIQKGLGESPGRFPLFIQNMPLSTVALEPLLAARETYYERAHVHVDVADIGAIDVARLVAERLGWS